ncbi:Ubiquinone/menaquinone biosynthesis C-methylase UbiE [Nocardia amikacinitolerans]|uniref:class I SAM-dependent DNA methyltransferase n=1 Tax=Nocardia amikacinitolerans TaxID=756689 RepID=UPI0008371018|nr:class I SAM-dependent methyltransferase [Nocardia amikacinitolerans]MCP2320431.1 Ubiquinone/menaquinone biosynthesis C-methylase UbiE [Nocardia amikacinitolerans]
MTHADVDATRTAYDDIAELYTGLFRGHLAAQPFDRAVLGAFAERLRANGSGPVADIGCGPGRITGHLESLGVPVFGMDLSPRMIELARNEFPGLRFEVGSMEELTIEDSALAGLVAWYSIIHLPPERVPHVLNEFYRVLRPGGHALLAFQAADAADTVLAFDHKVTRAYRWSPDRLAGLVREAGFTEIARMVRAPDPDERFDQAYLMVAKPVR